MIDEEQIIIFDYDGTLFITEDVDTIAVNMSRAHFNLKPIAHSDIKAMIGLPTTEFINNITADAQTDISEAFSCLFTKLEVELVERVGRLFPGVMDMLRSLKKRYKLAICSYASKEYLLAGCNKFGITDLMNIIVSEREGIDKCEAVKHIMHYCNAKRGVFVGDRLEDILAGRNNGLKTIAAAYGYGGSEVLCADFVVNNIKEIHDSIISLEKNEHR